MNGTGYKGQPFSFVEASDVPFELRLLIKNSLYLDKEERKFFSGFMYDCDLRYIIITSENIRYIFDGYDPDIIIRTRKIHNDFKEYQLDNLFYLIPDREKRPE